MSRRSREKAILLYGLCGGLLIVALRLAEYRFVVVEHSVEIYGALVASLFAGVWIWLGLTLTRTQEVVVVKEVPCPGAGGRRSPPRCDRSTEGFAIGS